MGLLDNIVEFIPHVKNKQKYVDISAHLLELSTMIMSLIVADDRHRKKHCKQYMGSD